MATKNNPGEYDCYNKAEPDEELFVLLGRDRHAAALVQLWAEMREREGEDPMVVDEARQIANRMAEHARNLGRTVSTLEAVAAFATTLQAKPSPQAAADVPLPTSEKGLSEGEIVVIGRGQPGKLVKILNQEDDKTRGSCNVQFPRSPGVVTVDLATLRRATGDEIENYRLAGGRV